MTRSRISYPSYLQLHSNAMKPKESRLISSLGPGFPNVNEGRVIRGLSASFPSSTQGRPPRLVQSNPFLSSVIYLPFLNSPSMPAAFAFHRSTVADLKASLGPACYSTNPG